jgi:hypothetical protein
VLDLGEAERLEHGWDVDAEAAAQALLEAVPAFSPGSSASGPTPTVPSAAAFCSSAPPRGIQSPWALSMAWRSSMQRTW